MRDLRILQGSYAAFMGTAVTSVIKASRGSVLSLSCTNLNSAIRYFQWHDLATVPTGGETPIISYPVYGNSGVLFVDEKYLGFYGRPFDTGITFAFSTTPLTYTAGVATDVIVEVRFA